MHTTRPGDPPADGSCDLEEGAGEAEEEEKAASAGDSGELEPEVSWRSMPHRPSLLPDGERPASAGASASAVSCLLSPDTSSERAPDAFDGADDEGPSVESPRTLLELLQETSHEGLLQALRPAGAPGTGISDGDPTDPAREGTLQLPLLLSDEAAQTCLDRPHRPEARSADVQQKPGRGAEAAAEAQVRGDGDSLTFRDFRLAPQLLKSLDNLGFEIPSPVQCAAVPAALARRDLIVQAKSGTGKTVAFALSLLQRLVHEVAASRESARAAAAAPFCARVAHPRASAPVSPSQSPSSASAAPSATAAPAQSSPSEEESSGLAFGLVVTPTRELAVQVANEIFRLAWFLRAPRVRLACLFGGRPLAVCQEQLRERPHLLITTPGRLLSLLRSKATQKILAAWPCVCGARRKGRAPAHAARDTEALDAGNDHGDAGTETKPHGDAQAPSAEAKSDEGEQPLAWEKEDKKDDAFCRPCRRMAAARRLKQHLRVFVVDEADLLFDEFFRPQMQALLTSLLTRRMQVLAFSATFPPPLLCFFEELVETLDTKWLAAEGTRRRKKDEDSLRQRALAFVAAHAEAQRQGTGTPELARAYVGRVEVGAGRSGAGAHHAPPGKEAVATDAAAAHMKAVAQVGDGLAPATLREDPRPQISAASGGALPDPDAVPGESPALDGRGGRQTDERATAEFLSTAGGVPKERPAGRAAGAAASEPEAPPEEPRKFERILLCSSFILHDSKRKRETERRANASEQTARSRALAAAASSSSSSSVVSARAKRAAELARLYATAQPGAPRREAHECAPAAQDGEAQSGGKPGDATDSPETARAAAGDLRQTAPDREGSEEREDRRAAGRPAAGDDESPMDTAATPESGPEEGEQPLACAGGRGSEAADGALAHEGGKRLPRKGVSKGDEPKLAEGPTPATPAEGRQRAGAQATAKAAAEAEASADSHKEAGPVASVTASAPPLADVVPGSPDESVLTASQPPSTSFTAAASASARVASYSSSSVLSPHASSSTGSPPSQSPSSGAVDAAEPNDREERRKCQPASASLPSPLLAGIQYALLLVPDEPSPMRQLGAKVRVLLRVLSTLRFRQAIVFCNSFDSGAQVANCLNQLGVGAIYTSARLRQEDRVRALLALKRVECRVLVCSDVISRGVDAVGVDLTVNLDLPMDKQTFLHRSGRAGRFGGECFCISIASEEEGPYWRYLAASFKIFLHSSLDALRRSGRRHAAAQPDASTGRGDSGYRERHDKTPSASCARQQRTGHTGARGSGEARDTSTCEKLDIRDGANEGFVRNCTPPDLAAGAPVSPGVGCSVLASQASFSFSSICPSPPLQQGSSDGPAHETAPDLVPQAHESAPCLSSRNARTGVAEAGPRATQRSRRSSNGTSDVRGDIPPSSGSHSPSCVADRSMVPLEPSSDRLGAPESFGCVSALPTHAPPLAKAASLSSSGRGSSSPMLETGTQITGKGQFFAEPHRSRSTALLGCRVHNALFLGSHSSTAVPRCTPSSAASAARRRGFPRHFEPCLGCRPFILDLHMTVDCPCEKSVCSWLVASTGGGKEATQASAAGVPHMAPNPVEDTRALGDSGDGRRDNEARVSETSTRRRASDGNPTMMFEISSYSPYGSGLIEQVLPVEDTVPLSVICPTDSSSAPSSLDWRRTQHVWGATCASLPSSASPLAAVLSPGRRVVQLNGHRADTQGETVVRRQRDKPSNTAVSRAWLKSSGELYIEPLRDAVSQVGPTQAHAAQSRTSRLGVGASAPRESAELGLVSESSDDEHSGVQEAEDRGGKKSSEETQAPYAHGSVAVVSATTTETARNILLRCLGPTGTTEGPAADGGMPERLKRSSFIPDALARSPAPNDSVKLVCDKSRPADKAVSRPDTGCKHTYMQEGKTESVGARTGSSPDAKQPSHSCVSEAVDQHAMWCIFMHASGALVRKTISQLGQRACLSKDNETGVWQWVAARGVVGTRGKANEDHHMRLPIYEVKTLHAQLWKAFNASSATQ